MADKKLDASTEDTYTIEGDEELEDMYERFAMTKQEYELRVQLIGGPAIDTTSQTGGFAMRVSSS